MEIKYLLILVIAVIVLHLANAQGWNWWSRFTISFIFTIGDVDFSICTPAVSPNDSLTRT